MEDNLDQPIDPCHVQPQPRRYVYRAAEPDTDLSHPLRRSTDFPREFQGIPGQLCPRTQLLKFRVYMRLN